MWVPVFMSTALCIPIIKAIAVSVLYVLLHMVQDWTIWTLYPATTNEADVFWKDSMFYKTLGFDQLLHVGVLLSLVVTNL